MLCEMENSRNAFSPDQNFSLLGAVLDWLTFIDYIFQILFLVKENFRSECALETVSLWRLYKH